MSNIAKMRHRVHLCSQKDVVEDGTLKLNRKGVLSMWAAIEAKSGSTFSTTGAAFGDSQNRRTHVIMTRYHRDLDITVMAWVYEERRKSAARWFKIIRWYEKDEYFVFDCRLVEQGGSAIVEPTHTDEQRTGPAKGLPEGVKF